MSAVREGENPRGSTNRLERLGPTNGSPKGKAQERFGPSLLGPATFGERNCLPSSTDKKAPDLGLFFERGEGG
ncbi:hypothetical protein DWB84_02985 [Saccharophagus sp. K07]|nr:hypothetical protein [Saccharophagus sp. K07]